LTAGSGLTGNWHKATRMPAAYPAAPEVTSGAAA